MKVKELISVLSSFDQESEIAIAYDGIYEFQIPDFRKIDENLHSLKGESLPKGSYVHEAV